jgi:hypothetical protein
MSARVESPPIGGGTLGGSFVIAVVVALSIGALLGSLVTYAIDNDGGASPPFVARGTPALTAVDAGYGSKGIEGPMLAERFSGLGSAVVWDAGKLEAMQGRQLAEQFRSEAGSAVVWDAGKLEAMEGRQLAEQFRSEAGSAVVWDAGKLEAMQGRQLAEEPRHGPRGGPLG